MMESHKDIKKETIEKLKKIIADLENKYSDEIECNNKNCPYYGYEFDFNCSFLRDGKDVILCIGYENEKN